MKTNELKRLLTEADPTGEAECVVDGVDIYFVELLNMYYDGRPVLLVMDQSKLPYYNITGLRVPSYGLKVNIHTMSIKDVFTDLPNASVEYDSPNVQVLYESGIEEIRREVKQELTDDKETKK